MKKYELLYIISSSVPEDQRESMIEKIKAMIEKNGGTIEGTDKWGMKKFAYPIEFKNEGFYVLVNLSIAPEAVKIVNNLMNITDGIVRQMFVRK